MTVTEKPSAPLSPSVTAPPSGFRALSIAMFKGFVRDKTTLFFTFLFPLMFLVIFGLIFGDAGTSKTELGIVGDGQVVEALEQSPAVEPVRIDTVEAAAEQVRAGDLPAYVVQDGDTVRMGFAASDRTRAGVVTGLVGGVVNQANIAATGQAPRYQFEASQVEDESLQPIQYLTPGLLSWAVSIAAVFGASIQFVNWRKNQVLRRLRLAPVQPVTVLSSRLLVSLGVGVLQFAVFIAIALLPMFGLQLTGSWWLAIPLVMLGTLAFFSIGMLVGAFCKTEEAASSVANLITLPMAFLSGAFFPLDEVPQWLQSISLIFPMRHLNDGMLDVMVRGEGVAALLWPAVILLGFTAVISLIAAKVFRWEK